MKLKRIELPPLYLKEEIPARRGQIPWHETAQRWPHLREIADKLMPRDKDVKAGLLIGLSCTKALQPRGLIVSRDEEPYTKRTSLSWGIIGKTDYLICMKDESEPLAAHCIVTQEGLVDYDQMRCLFTLQSKVKEVFDPAQVNKMLELDFSERKTDECALSYEDKKFSSKVKGGIHQLPSGQYEAP